jgi:hypothetical protein
MNPLSAISTSQSGAETNGLARLLELQKMAGIRWPFEIVNA